jgi:hypothetical protein
MRAGQIIGIMNSLQVISLDMTKPAFQMDTVKYGYE